MVPSRDLPAHVGVASVCFPMDRSEPTRSAFSGIWGISMTVAVSTTALPTIFSEPVSPGTIGAPTGIDVSGEWAAERGRSGCASIAVLRRVRGGAPQEALAVTAAEFVQHVGLFGVFDAFGDDVEGERVGEGEHVRTIEVACPAPSALVLSSPSTNERSMLMTLTKRRLR
jgi:hypothetical protein